jgi:hypothetical protein
MQTRSKTRLEKELLLIAEAPSKLLQRSHLLNSPPGSTPTHPPGFTPGNNNYGRLVANKTLEFIEDLELKVERR